MATVLCVVTSSALAQQAEPAAVATEAATAEPVTETPPTDATTPAPAQAPAPAPAPATSIPTDTELQTSGARIGRIDIKVVDVFDPENPKESGWLYRTANRLHIDTRDNTVRTQLLIKPGALYSRRMLDETERNLRSRRYLEDASITPVAYHAETNTVDLLVRVHDVWTLNPGVSFGRSGGENKSGVQISESNLLGWGKSVEMDYSKDVDRNSWELSYNDPNLVGTRWTLDAAYSDTSDGGRHALNVLYPFYSLNTRWSGGLDVSRDERREQRFDQGVAVDQYLVKRDSAGVQVGWSTGVQQGKRNRPDWVQRWSLGYRSIEQTYAVDPELGTTRLPENSKLRYPWVGLSWFQDNYLVTRNREQIARTEDLFMGRALNLSYGVASRGTGSDRNSRLITITFQDAFRLSERQFVFIKLGINGRREEGQWQGTTFSSSLRYDLRQSPRALLVLALSHAHTENPDDSQQLYLGSDEGLRGYPLRYRSGKERSVLLAEQRFYTNKQILRLLSVAGAAFVDVGSIRGESNPLPDGKQVFTDVGFGLRLGNIRSSRGDMFHLDVAYPLNATGTDRKLQFSVVTKNTF